MMGEVNCNLIKIRSHMLREVRILITSRLKWTCEKKVLNSDGQNFHQYQQNKQSPLTFTD